jgi:hypothetical protein
MSKHEKDQLEKLIAIERAMETMGRPQMLEEAVPNYDHNCSIYPDQIRVSFSDGHTEVYERRVEQPAPVIMENIRIIRKWKQGYINQPMRRRCRK